MRKKVDRVLVKLLCVNILIMVSCSKQDAIEEFKENPIDASTVVIGNSSANHANGGKVCGDEKSIYFSNWNEDGYLYKMIPGTNEKELVLEEPCYNINVIEDYIYYQSEKDHSILTYCISNGESKTLVKDIVEDMVVTSDAIYFISNTIEKIDLEGKERVQLLPEGEYFYLDVCGDNLFYTCIEDNVNLYTVSKEGKNPHLLLEGAKGSVVIEDKIFYTGVEDDMLYCYDIKDQTKKLIDMGYNANIWNDNIYYIRNNYLCCYSNNIYTTILQDYFEQIADSYELEAYYIVNDYMYIVYFVYGNGIEYEEMIALNLTIDDTLLK